MYVVPYNVEISEIFCKWYEKRDCPTYWKYILNEEYGISLTTDYGEGKQVVFPSEDVFLMFVMENS